MRGRPSNAQNMIVMRPLSRRWAMVSTPLPVGTWSHEESMPRTQWLRSLAPDHEATVTSYRKVVVSVGQTDDLQGLHRTIAHLARLDARMRVEHGKFDVLQRGRAGEEIESLEDEADLLVANVRAVVAVEPRDVDPVAAHAAEALFSERVGCRTFLPIYNGVVDLTQLCLDGNS